MSAILSVVRSVRVLARSPGLSIAVVLMLAVGIGAGTAVFSVLDAVLLAPLPYPDADRLVNVHRFEGASVRHAPVATQDFLDVRDELQGLATIAGHVPATFTVGGEQGARHVLGAGVTQDFFAVFGLAPLRGRWLDAADEAGDSDGVVISDRFRRDYFAGRDDVLGAELRLDGEPRTVIGVAPPQMDFPPGTDLWKPLGFARFGLQRGSNFIFVSARLQRDVDRATIQDRVSGLAARLAADHPAEHSGLSLRVIGVQERLVSNIRGSLWMLAVAVSLVILTVCANAATLLSGRMLARQRDLATRSALGASPRRLALQPILESLLLSCVGAAAGIALAAAGVEALVALRPPGLPSVDAVALNWSVLAFAIGAALVTGALCGALPAMYALRHDVACGLQTVQRSVTQRGRLHRWMVVGQFGLSMALLVGVGSLLVTIARLERVDAGFDTDPLLTAMIALPSPSPVNFNDPDAVASQIRRNTPFLAALHERLGALPGVADTGVIDTLPLSGTNNLNGSIEVPDRTFAPGRAPIAEFRWVTPSYFSAAGIPLLAGANFPPVGDERSPDDAILINAALADSLWPNETAIGKRIGAVGRSFTVIGVVGSVRQWSLDRDASPEIYFAYDRVVAPSTAAIVVRANVDPETLAELVRRTVAEVDAAVPVFAVRTMAQVTAAGNARRTFALTLLAVFGGIAVLVTAIGLYGLTAHAVARRTREIGVRIALGADRRRVVGQFLRDGVATALLGIGVGTAVGVLFGRLLRGLVWGVGGSMPFVYLAAGALLGALAFAATLVPARRAASVDSVEALRHE